MAIESELFTLHKAFWYAI